MTEITNENLEPQVPEQPDQVEVNEIIELVREEAPEAEVIQAEVPEPKVIQAEAQEAKVIQAGTPKAEEEFDWESIESGMDGYTARRRDELENLYNNTLNTVQEKEVQEGTVISMNKREVVIDIGYKSDGIVSLNEFRYNPEMKVGDKVDVYVENLEDPKGQMILSHKKARAMKSWKELTRHMIMMRSSKGSSSAGLKAV